MSFSTLFRLLLIGAVFLVSSCNSYYVKNKELMDAVYSSDLKKAGRLLANDQKFESQKRNLLLFYLNKGTVLWMAGDYENSLVYFRKADYFIEDFNKSGAEQLAAVFTNKNITTYAGEDFEKVMLHYYTTTAYLMTGRLDEALIEAKRMLLKMQRNSDKIKAENKYKRDAFAHQLLGLVYDARGEYNDAFIAYRNAFEVYKVDYKQLFSSEVPNQLKRDLIRTAYLSGFKEEQERYEKEFYLSFSPEKDMSKREVLVFWNNGLGPVKDQNSVNFSIIPAGNGYVNFVNHDLGFSFPYYVGDKDERNDLLGMRFFRISLPEYISRVPIYKSARIEKEGESFVFESAENINAIAFQSLKDRMLRELGEACLRMALKQLAVYKANKEKKDGLALAASLYGAISEQADTRNWQLVPYEINYARIPLQASDSVLTVQLNAGQKANDTNRQTLRLAKQQKGLQFIVFQTLDYSGYRRN